VADSVEIESAWGQDPGLAIGRVCLIGEMGTRARGHLARGERGPIQGQGQERCEVGSAGGMEEQLRSVVPGLQLSSSMPL
jgi:hypothetical protein